jgi:hypothetical protein
MTNKKPVKPHPTSGDLTLNLNVKVFPLIFAIFPLLAKTLELEQNK